MVVAGHFLAVLVILAVVVAALEPPPALLAVLAVLFRAGYLSADLEIELANRRIPYEKWGGLKFLEAAHIKDLLAAMGVGLTGQYLEDVGRKLIGGLFGKAAGGLVGSLARGATGVAFSFATTYALGQVARRYYAGGRTMNTQMLKDAYTSTLGQARGLQAQYMPQIEQQARTVDMGKIVQMVRAS
jgi:uncharacterized protein (DUF697 family)